MSENIIPECCPLIETCKVFKTESEYETCCATTVWIYCGTARKTVNMAKYRKTPAVWKKKAEQ